jgi:ketosteroid isomerase-like protein
MKKSNRLLSVILLATALAMLLSAISCQKQDTEADIAAINEMYDQYSIYVNTGDLDSFISLWDDNAIRMEPDNPSVIGKENIRKSFEIPFAVFNIKFSHGSDTELQVANDIAFIRGTYTMSLTPKEGGPTTNFDGKALSINKKQADGSWKIYINIFNNNAPPTVE